MGLGGISIWQLLIILLIVVVVFGTGKLGNIGKDLGSAVRNFKHSMREGEQQEGERQSNDQAKDSDDTGTDKH